MGLLVPIVEGDGEVEAVPVLMRRYLQLNERWDLTIARPKNAHGCGNLTKEGGLERFVELAFRERDCSGVLVLMDADGDEDCPKQLASDFVARIANCGARAPVAVVFARREYEAWFLASLETMVGKEISGLPGFPPNVTFAADVEELRSVKQWISRHFAGRRSYKETEAQAPMSNLIDFGLAAKNSRSFRRFTNGMGELLRAIDSRSTQITPAI